MTEKKTLEGQVNEFINSSTQSIPQGNLFHKIPAKMRIRPQWVTWGFKVRDGKEKPAKVPYQTNGQPADVSNPATWMTYEQALKAYLDNQNRYEGVGLSSQ